MHKNVDLPDIRLGIDLGGTKIEIIALEARNGKEVYRQRIPTPKNYKDTIKAMADMVKLAEKSVGRKGSVGVGIPGAICPDKKVIRGANTVWLNNNALDIDMSKALGGRDIRVDNDANCLAVSEATDGAGVGKHTVFAVIIGTGCGAGISVDGKPLVGRNAIAGEWGHNPLPFPKTYADKKNIQKIDQFFDRASNNVFDPKDFPRKITETDFFTDKIEDVEYPGLQCYCGRRGCMETWVSGKGLKADHMRVTGEDISTHDITARAMKGDVKSKESLKRYTSRLARGLAVVTNILDPDVIVLGGGMSNVASLYDDLPAMMEPFIFFPKKPNLKIVPTIHGDSSGVRGAAWLWPMVSKT